MADEPAPATGATEQSSTEPGTDPDQGLDLGEAGKKALELERKARRDAESKLKELEPLAARLKEFEDQSKTDAEKAAEARQTAERERDDAKAEAARLRAAIKHGLSGEDLDLLGSGTADEIEARAQRLADRLAGAGKPRPPAPDPAQGATRGAAMSTADQFAAAISQLQ